MAIDAKISFMNQTEMKLSTEITADAMSRAMKVISDVLEGFEMRETFRGDDTPDDLLEGYLNTLKEQEPRVMAPTEVYTADFVYVEFDGVITPALRTSKEREGHRESYFATQQLGGEWMRWDDYGITWRCWTSRPTDEQKKAVKWE